MLRVELLMSTVASIFCLLCGQVGVFGMLWLCLDWFVGFGVD